MLTKESALVRIWVGNVRSDKNPNGMYTKEQVPNLYNLREMVYELLDESDKEPFL